MKALPAIEEDYVRRFLDALDLGAATRRESIAKLQDICCSSYAAGMGE
jgi:hypothetical protein